MKIKEFIKVPKLNLDTTSSGTIYSITPETEAQDIVPQDQVPEKIVAEMVDGEILEPSTCFQKLDPVKGTKIRAKRKQKAGIAGVKLARTKRTGGASVRLKGAQVKKAKNKGPSFRPKLSGRKPVKSKVVRPKKR